MQEESKQSFIASKDEDGLMYIFDRNSNYNKFMFEDVMEEAKF
jgi:hypothetical protein